MLDGAPGARLLLWGIRLASAIGDPQRAKGGCAGLLRGIPENIPTPGDNEILKPGSGDLAGQLCFQQSTGNSTRPQVDVAPCAVRDRFLHQDIGDL
jgi:hypothetical protein